MWLYAKRQLAVPLDRFPTVDYVLSAEGHGHLYDASAYDGGNIGHFANDAGLLPGLKAMGSLVEQSLLPCRL